MPKPFAFRLVALSSLGASFPVVGVRRGGCCTSFDFAIRRVSVDLLLCSGYHGTPGDAGTLVFSKKARRSVRRHAALVSDV